MIPYRSKYMSKYLSKYALSEINDQTGDTYVDHKVIIEDLSGTEKPVVVYQHEIEDVLEPFAEAAEDENYRNFNNEIQQAFYSDYPWRQSYEQAIGVRVTRLDKEHYEERGRVGQVLQDLSDAMSIPEVAELLGVTRTTVYRWVKGEGVAVSLPSVKLGGHYKINTEELENWVIDNR